MIWYCLERWKTAADKDSDLRNDYDGALHAVYGYDDSSRYHYYVFFLLLEICLVGPDSSETKKTLRRRLPYYDGCFFERQLLHRLLGMPTESMGPVLALDDNFDEKM